MLSCHVIAQAWVKVTGFSHLLPIGGEDAEQRVPLIIGLSASVFMLDFRVCPAHTLETPTAGRVQQICQCSCHARERTVVQSEAFTAWTSQWHVRQWQRTVPNKMIYPSKNIDLKGQLSLYCTSQPALVF